MFNRKKAAFCGLLFGAVDYATASPATKVEFYVTTKSTRPSTRQRIGFMAHASSRAGPEHWIRPSVAMPSRRLPSSFVRAQDCAVAERPHLKRKRYPRETREPIPPFP